MRPSQGRLKVGDYDPPPYFEVPVLMRSYCDDLEYRFTSIREGDPVKRKLLSLRAKRDRGVSKAEGLVKELFDSPLLDAEEETYAADFFPKTLFSRRLKPCFS
jgi:hypothetical protein